MTASCADICRDAHRYLDGEVVSEVSIAISLHVQACGRCAEMLRFETRVRRVVARCCAERVPDTLRVRVLHAIYTASP